MQANVWTSAAFKQDAWSFLTAGTVLNPDTRWTAQGESKISLRELLTWPASATEGTSITSSRLEVIQKNLTGNVFNAVVQTTLIGLGFKFAKNRHIQMGINVAIVTPYNTATNGGIKKFDFLP